VLGGYGPARLMGPHGARISELGAIVLCTSESGNAQLDTIGVRHVKLRNAAKMRLKLPQSVDIH